VPPPDDRRAEVFARDDEQFQNWVADDSISSYGLFLSNVHSKSIEIGNEWMLVKTLKNDYVLFVNIESSDSCCPIIRCSFKVLNDLTVECFDSKQRRDSNELTWLLGEGNKLKRWSQLPNICTFLSNTCLTSLTPSPTTDEHVEAVTDRFKELI
jgi:hypothetical protein